MMLSTTELLILLKKSYESKKQYHIFAKINVDSDDFLPIEKRLTLHNVTIHIKSVLNKDKNHY